MIIVFWASLAVFFLINIVILYKDWVYKVIPNPQLVNLLILLPIIALLARGWEYIPMIDPVRYTVSILFTCIISLSLYLFHGWAAGDAKYTIILSLFLFQGNFISFAGNIAVFTLIILVLFSVIQAQSIRPVDKKVIEKKTWEAPKETRDYLLLAWHYIFIVVILFSLLQWAREGLARYFTAFAQPNHPLYAGLSVLILLLYRWIHSYLLEKSRKSFGVILLWVLAGTTGFIAFMRWVERFTYDIIFLLKYSVPTMVLAALFLIGFTRIIRKYDLIPKTVHMLKYGDLIDYEHVISTFSHTLKEKNAYGVIDTIKEVFSVPLHRDSLTFLRELTRQAQMDESKTYMVVYNNHPYAHIIFLAFLYTIITGQNLAYSLLHKWTGFLEVLFAHLEKFL